MTATSWIIIITAIILAQLNLQELANNRKELSTNKETKMWRLQLFLLISTCFLIPYEAKPVTSSTPTTRQSNHMGLLVEKDLADLLVASMQERGIKLTSNQESTVKSLRDMEQSKLQDDALMLHLDMDVIINVLIGNNTDASCEHVIKDIQRSMDKNSVSLSLKSFQALCTFNNIECSPQQTEQIIKDTSSAKLTQSALLGSRSTRTALEQATKTSIIKDDRDSIVNFLQARTLPQLSAILSTLLQVCGADGVETQRILENLVEIGSKDSSKTTEMTALQVNGFSTLIITLMNSLTNIANGNKSSLCAATPTSWIVRQLDMGVSKKVIIMGLMTAKDHSLPPTHNSLIQKGNAMASLMDADVPLTKSAPTSKRAIGPLSHTANLAGITMLTEPENMIDAADDTVLTNNVGYGPIENPGGDVIDNANRSDDGYTVIKGVDAGTTQAVDVAAPNDVKDLVTGGGSSEDATGYSRSDNTISTSPRNIVDDNATTEYSLVDDQVPVASVVNVPNSALSTVTESSDGYTREVGNVVDGGVGGLTKSGNTITSGAKTNVTGYDSTDIPLAVDVAALNQVTGLGTDGSRGSAGSSGDGVANQAGNVINKRNTGVSGVAAEMPVASGDGLTNKLSSVVACNSGESGSSGNDSALKETTEAGSQYPANSLANDIKGSSLEDIVAGNDNSIISEADAVVPVSVDEAELLNTLTQDGAPAAEGVIQVVDRQSNLLRDENNNDLSQTINGDYQVPTVPEPSTEEPPILYSPFLQTPTPSPQTAEPPTEEPPTPYLPTPELKTPSPLKPSPSTLSPLAPNPNLCYRRYCRKWRTRPSYLCGKICGGSYVYRP